MIWSVDSAYFNTCVNTTSGLAVCEIGLFFSALLKWDNNIVTREVAPERQHVVEVSWYWFKDGFNSSD
jgi:hypothetical protein